MIIQYAEDGSDSSILMNALEIQSLFLDGGWGVGLFLDISQKSP